MSAFEDLARKLPLPAGWSAPAILSDRIEIGVHTLRRVGIEAIRVEDGLEITGSAASSEDDPSDRAYYELYERVAAIEAIDQPRPHRDRIGEVVGQVRSGTPTSEEPRRRLSRSNGVAFHFGWEPACERALLELVERDAVLSAWYGERGVQKVTLPDGLDTISTHRWRAGFVERAHGGVEAFTAIVIGFPRSPELPLARGFAAARTPTPALVRAASEAIQNLAFLWDSPVPTKSPAFSPTPGFHLDYYLTPTHHGILERWMDSSIGYGRQRRVRESAVRFIDLTPPGAPGNGTVARAICSEAHELVFGDPSEAVLQFLPEDRWVHPVP